MVQPPIAEGREQVVDTMIGLTRLSTLQRAIIAGSSAMEFYLALRKRGFIRVATPATCRIARGQHAIGLVAGQDSSGTIEGALASISPFLGTNATVAVLIDSRDGAGCSLRIRSKLQQMGFQIEAGVRCDQGLVLSAYRQNIRHLEIAA